MSVHKTTSQGKPRYLVRWREAGRNRQRSFDRKADADLFESTVRRARQLQGVEHRIGQDITLKEYASSWWDEVAKPTLGTRTLEQYALALDLRIVPELGGWRLRDIKPATIEAWIADLEKRGDGRPSILRAIAVLGTIMRRAGANGLVDANPVHLVRKPRALPPRRPDSIAPEQVEAIRAQLKPFDATLVSVLAYAGLRPESEALTLSWAQVGEKTLAIPASLKRGGRERHVRLLEPLAEDLKAWRGVGRKPRGLVFPQDGGWTRNDWQNWRRRVWRPAAKVAGLPDDSRPRDLRGSFASLLIYEGRNVVEVAQQLGHSPEMCLRSYARVFAEAPDPEHRVSAENAIRLARQGKTTPTDQG